MAAALGFFILGLLLLALGGDSIVKGASGLAQRFGLSPFASGLLLVAFGTSLPELAVNARAVWVGSQALALGNAIGSNVVNFGLTLGAAALAAPLLVRWRALVPLLLCFIVASLALIGFGLDGVLNRMEGVILLLAFVAVLAWTLVRSRHEAQDVRDAITAFASTRADLGLNLLRFVLAAVLLYYGARLVVQHAPVLGIALGMAPLLTGLIVVAIGTALPEVAAAVVAARRGHGDMVLGHVIGSSLFNLLVVVGGMAAFRPLPLPTSFVHFEVPAALAFALVLVPMLKGDLRISRTEGGVLLAAFAAWLLFELAVIQH
ncbi:MAG TPA: calcium/sodium antiporter [Luteimonas sp.]|nr:calcium/sodium antiporter [Luteimonas sp.]